jgi:hypothetical protein
VPLAEDLLRQILQELSSGRGVASPRAVPRNALAMHFYIVFFSVLGLTLVSLSINVYLVVAIENPPEQVGRLIETVSTSWKLGFGALVGLLGGKTLKG